MSGHSKWSTIKRQKGVKDTKRGAAFTKLSNAITIAVREGGNITDPDMNFRLRLAVEKARAANMPKENIQRAIERGSGAAGGANFEQITYEGFGPAGSALLIESITDNKQRTVAAVKSLLDRSGGNLGGQGSVGYLFSRKGNLFVGISGKNPDEAALEMIDLGAQDVEVVEDGVEVFTLPEKLFEVRKKIEEAGYEVKSAEIIYDPQTSIDITDEQADKVIRLLENLEELDDVHKVYTNANFI